MTLPQIEKDYIETGQVKYVLLDFPLESIHPYAFKAHEAANCAGEQGRYWEMHDRLFAHQSALSVKELSAHAETVGLDLAAFEQCLSSGKHAGEIRNDLKEGIRAGVRGTPTFFVGLTGSDSSKVKAVTIIRGAQPYSRFKQVIDSMLGLKKKINKR